jgi:alkylhydroperoxidase family enzyme
MGKHRERIEVVVSVANECLYYHAHHIKALNNYWKVDDKIGQIVKGFQSAPLTDEEKALFMCIFKNGNFNSGTIRKHRLYRTLKK